MYNNFSVFKYQCPYRFCFKGCTFSKKSFHRFLKNVFLGYKYYLDSLFPVLRRVFLRDFNQLAVLNKISSSLSIKHFFLIKSRILRRDSTNLFFYGSKPSCWLISDFLTLKNSSTSPVYSLLSPRPTKIKKFTLLKSAHVHKTARTQLEIRTYSWSLLLYIRYNLFVLFFQHSLNFFKENLPYNLGLSIRKHRSYFI